MCCMYFMDLFLLIVEGLMAEAPSCQEMNVPISSTATTCAFNMGHTSFGHVTIQPPQGAGPMNEYNCLLFPDAPLQEGVQNPAPTFEIGPGESEAVLFANDTLVPMDQGGNNSFTEMLNVDSGQLQQIGNVDSGQLQQLIQQIQHQEGGLSELGGQEEVMGCVVENQDSSMERLMRDIEDLNGGPPDQTHPQQ